jgi:beta-barrel assembly-enhancing protease
MPRYFFRIHWGLLVALLFVLLHPWIFSKGEAMALTIEEERKLGDEVVREVERKFTQVRDPQILEYLNKLGQEILKQAGTQPYPFRFYLLKDPQLNAFSIPGGHIFLTTGILEIMESEGELAGLLGHEIAHVARHHISNQIEKQKKIGLATLAAALLGVFAGDPTIAAAAIAGSVATAQTLILKYSRDDEDDADNYGFKYMSRTGFDPKAMIDLLEKLRRWGSFGSEVIPAYMQTHPLTGERMSHVEDLLHQYESQDPWKRRTSDDFRRLQTIILTQHGDLQRARNRFLSWSKDAQSLFWVYYGRGWIDVREGKLDSAIDQFEKAASLKPLDFHLLRDEGQVFMMKGNYDQAIQKLGQASLLEPKDGSTAFLMGRAYQEKREYPAALENFRKALILGLEGEDLYYYLGLTYGNLNDLGQAHYHFGKSFQKKGDREKALFHYKTALKYVGKDPVQKDRIDKEIKTLESEKSRGKKADF